jgi:hypothetical protein
MRQPAVSAMKGQRQRLRMLSAVPQTFTESSYFHLEDLQFGKSSIQNL